MRCSCLFWTRRPTLLSSARFNFLPGATYLDTAITRDEVRSGIITMARALMSRADELNALDAATGDGDLGVSIRIGAQAVIDEMQSAGNEELPALLSRSGIAFNRAAGSTIGALIATAALRAAKETNDATEIDLALLARIAGSAADAIAQRGKAHRRDKTLLDALEPAADALQQAATEKSTIKAGGEAALTAARAGAEATRDMQSRAGRGKWVGSRTVGHVDAGAAALVIALEAVVSRQDGLEREGGGALSLQRDKP
jgi:phosphoenolpyruvate---glycerone phosphotransferase subunit DhaL